MFVLLLCAMALAPLFVFTQAFAAVTGLDPMAPFRVKSPLAPLIPLYALLLFVYLAIAGILWNGWIAPRLSAFSPATGGILGSFYIIALVFLAAWTAVGTRDLAEDEVTPAEARRTTLMLTLGTCVLGAVICFARMQIAG